MSNSWYQSKAARGVQTKCLGGAFPKRKGRRSISEWEMRHEIRKQADIDEGRSSEGRSLSPEEIEAFMKKRGS